MRPDAAVVGIGATDLGELPGKSANELAVAAGIAALADSGIPKAEVDGLITCMPPMAATSQSGRDEEIGHLLGINPAFSTTLEYGACEFSLQLGVMALQANLANTILLVYGTNQRTARTSFGKPVGGGSEWASAIGLIHVAGPAAMAARQHMRLYGTTEEQLGWVSVAQREWAQKNGRAIFRDPLTIDDYLSYPYIVAPLRRPDLTMISDGGAAFLLTSRDRASDRRTDPVYVASMAQQSALRNDQNPSKLMRPWIATIANRLYANIGLSANDIDIAYFQDATSVWVLQMLEMYGFCSTGESGAFVADGNTRPGGMLPVNTNGGQLSEAYMWNWMHLYECIEQLRGSAGERQVDNARVALHAQTHDFFKGAAAILSNASEL